jgi:hypothetical protein
MGWTTNLLTGLAEHLAAGDVGVWRPPPGVYQPDETGIVIRAIPDKPDRLITLAAYPVDSLPGLADITVGIQIRVRAGRNPTDCDDLADAVYDLLDGAHSLTFDGVRVVHLYRQSHASLGTDGNSRWSRSENYYADAMRPTPGNAD